MKPTKKEINLKEIIGVSISEALAEGAKPSMPVEVAPEKTPVVEIKTPEVIPVEVPPSTETVVAEAVVASKQKFDLKSDFLSDETKQAHLELYGQYVETRS